MSARHPYSELTKHFTDEDRREIAAEAERLNAEIMSPTPNWPTPSMSKPAPIRYSTLGTEETGYKPKYS